MYGTNGLGAWLSLLGPFKTGLDLSGLRRLPKLGLRWSSSDNYVYDSDREDLSGGEIAGIVCGSLLALLLIIWILWMCVAVTSPRGSTSYVREEVPEPEALLRGRRRPLCPAATQGADRLRRGLLHGPAGGEGLPALQWLLLLLRPLQQG
jgi:hypothetical protein